MVNYCVVPGCKTNRKNHEKLTTFHVPNDPVVREEWKKIVGVEYLEDKHRICRKHFSPEDVVSSTDFFDSSGNFITTLPLKHPKLRKSAKPKFVLKGSRDSYSNLVNTNNMEDTNIDGNDVNKNNTENIKNSENNPMQESNKNESIQNIETKKIDNSIVALTKEQSIITTDEITNSKDQSFAERSKKLMYKMIIKYSNNNKSVEGKCSEEKNTFSTKFSTFCLKLHEIKLPENCFCTYSEENGYITLFEICVSKLSEDNTCAIVRKSLFVNNRLEIQYSILSSAVESELFDLKTNVADINDLESTFRKFIQTKICVGIADLEDVNLVENISYTDSLGILRHRRCNLLSIHQKCFVCSRVRKIIYQKKMRMSKRDTKITIKSNFNNSNLKYLRKICAQRKIINRIKMKIKQMKSDLNKTKQGIKNINLEDLLDRCFKKDIPDIQKTLLRQIVSSAQKTHPNGQRYEDSWLTSCLLLYTKFPNEYRNIQNLNLLPLPCVRTIKRYFSLTQRNCGLSFHTYSKAQT